MGDWVIGADELAQSRFQTSAMIETTSALATLAGRPPAAGLKEWAATHRPAYQERIADDPFAATFVQAALRPRWTAGIVVIPPQRSDRTFHDELRHVHEMALQEARRSLSIDGRLPRPLHTRQLTTRAAELLEWVWTRTLRADWPRRQRIFEADIVSRTQRLSSGGWAAAVDGMRHELRWLGDGRLRVSAYEHPPRTIADADLMFIPSTSPPARVTWAEPDRYAVIYPCAGLLADTPATSSPSRTLAKLIGPARATILDQLREPRSTNQLVALTGYSLGSVGGHLKTLLDAELVQRRRSGRSVLYYRTSLGDKLTCIHQ